MKWWKQNAIAFDQQLNAFLFGWADETLSARAWRKRDTSLGKLAYRIINGIFFWQQNHCHQSWVAEMERRQLPRSYRPVSA
jgi:hypothetical protein